MLYAHPQLNAIECIIYVYFAMLTYFIHFVILTLIKAGGVKL